MKYFSLMSYLKQKYSHGVTGSSPVRTAKENDESRSLFLLIMNELCVVNGGKLRLS